MSWANHSRRLFQILAWKTCFDGAVPIQKGLQFLQWDLGGQWMSGAHVLIQRYLCNSQTLSCLSVMRNCLLRVCICRSSRRPRWAFGRHGPDSKSSSLVLLIALHFLVCIRNGCAHLLESQDAHFVGFYILLVELERLLHPHPLFSSYHLVSSVFCI